MPQESKSGGAQKIIEKGSSAGKVLIAILSFLLFTMLLFMGGVAYFVVNYGPSYIQQLDTDMAKTINDVTKNISVLQQQKHDKLMNQIQVLKNDSGNSISFIDDSSDDTYFELASVMRETFSRFETEQNQQEDEVANSIKEMANAFQELPQTIIDTLKEGHKSNPETETQAVDYRHMYESKPLTKNQSNPWSPILNEHVRKKFLPVFGKDPRRFRLCYNATEHGWERKHFMPNCLIKSGLMTIIKTVDGNIFGGFTIVPLMGRHMALGWGQNGIDDGCRLQPKLCEDPKTSPFIFRIEKDDNQTLTRLDYPFKGEREEKGFRPHIMDHGKNSIIHFIGAFQLNENCNKHKDSLIYLDGDNYILPQEYINGEHNFVEGLHWLTGDTHFQCEAVEIYEVAF